MRVAIGKALVVGICILSASACSSPVTSQAGAPAVALSGGDMNKLEAAYVSGRQLQKTATPDSLKQALQLFQQSQGLPALWEQSQWHISEVAGTLGQEKTVRQALEAIRDRSSSEKIKAAAEYGLAQSYLRGNEPDKAQESFANVRDNYPSTQYAIGSAYYLGEANIDKPDKQSDAIKLFREYLRKSPDGHFAREIVTRLSTLKGYTPSVEDHDLFGQVHFVHGEWDAAMADWKKSSPVKRWFEYGTCQARLGRSSEAKTTLLNGLKAHPNDPNVPTAAQMLSRMGSRDEAIAVWNTVKSTSSKFADQALWQLALRKPAPEALANYGQIAAKYPQSNYAPDAAWWLFWDQLKQGRPTAMAAAQNGLKKYPKSMSAPRFSYWIGKLYERANKKAEAKTAYQRTVSEFSPNYYAHRARARLSAMAGNKDRGWSTNVNRPEPASNWTWPPLGKLMDASQLTATYGDTVATLSRLNQYDEALSLLPEDAPNPVLRSWLFANLGLPLDAINTAFKGLHGTPDASAGRWELAYPLLYSSQIASEARQKQVDPLLVHALVREESRYNTSALSHSNAVGLMQLLPGTAYGVAKRIGLTLGGNADIYKPENNLRLGTHYLSYTHNRFSNNALFAVASYNGGPNAVQSWSHRMTSPDYDVFVENIPLSETRDYARKVFGSYWTYEQLYK